MKRILIIGLFAMSLIGCEAIEEEREVRRKYENSIYVEDNNGKEYRIVEIEGCEFYLFSEYRQMGITKVDCNCVADTTKRK